MADRLTCVCGHDDGDHDNGGAGLAATPCGSCDCPTFAADPDASTITAPEEARP